MMIDRDARKANFSGNFNPKNSNYIRKLFQLQSNSIFKKRKTPTRLRYKSQSEEEEDEEAKKEILNE